MRKITVSLSLAAAIAAGSAAIPAAASAASGRPACLASVHGAGCTLNTTIVKHSIAVGKATDCTVLGDSRLACWGNNSDGQAIAPTGTGFASVTVGGYHACAIKTDNGLVCWGDNHFRQSTVGGATCSPNRTDSTPDNICPEPPLGPIPLKAIDVSAGKFHTCAILTDETIACWGLNVDMEGRASGQAMPPGGDFSQVSAGGYHTCALALDTSIACWGGNWDGQTNAPAGGGFKQIAAGRTHTCALRTNGSITCWGEPTNGRTTPPAGTGFRAIASAYDHSCAIRSSGAITCWGSNSAGQTRAPTGSFKELAVGGNSGIARRSDGMVVGWGDNSDGQGTTPTGSSIGGPVISLAMLKGLGSGRWKVTVTSRAGSKALAKVQITAAKVKPADSAATSGALAFKSSVTTSGARPQWIRIGDSIGRWSQWAPVQPQVGS